MALVCALLLFGAPAQAQNARPNIVVIFGDGIGYLERQRGWRTLALAAIEATGAGNGGRGAALSSFGIGISRLSGSKQTEEAL